MDTTEDGLLMSRGRDTSGIVRGRNCAANTKEDRGYVRRWALQGVLQQLDQGVTLDEIEAAIRAVRSFEEAN